MLNILWSLKLIFPSRSTSTKMMTLLLYHLALAASKKPVVLYVICIFILCLIQKANKRGKLLNCIPSSLVRLWQLKRLVWCVLAACHVLLLLLLLFRLLFCNLVDWIKLVDWLKKYKKEFNLFWKCYTSFF